MNSPHRSYWYGAVVVLVTLFSACRKNGTNESPYHLSYGDSIFYVKNPNTGYIIQPLETRPGIYVGFPEGIEIDEHTGAINIQDSESGLRYKITHISPNGDSTSTKIVISGINFYDKIYNLSSGDSIAYPVYNANGQVFQPGLFGTGTNNSFDDDNGCNSQGCAVSLANGSINLAQSIRNGAIPGINDAQKEFTYYYKLEDQSQKALNKLKVKLYYYDRQGDIPQYLWDILLIDHAGTILRSAGTQRLARPRPPCIIIIGQ
ncbi:MAG: hypothetical protein GC171_16870 [Terrimonas sp.]|nr:hypothetical protein [Terrimonas sp.]